MLHFIAAYPTPPEEAKLATITVLTRLAEETWAAAAAIGAPAYARTRSEALVLKNRRSLYVAAPVVKGEMLALQNVRTVRPGFRLKPGHLDVVLERRATYDLAFREPLAKHILKGGIEI
jgi:sialic acid synthase SpsE